MANKNERMNNQTWLLNVIGGQCDLQKSLQIRKCLWDVKGGGRQNAVDANLLRSFVPGRETSKHCQVQRRTYKYFAFQIISVIEQTQQLRGWRWACCPRSPPPPPPPPPWQDPSPPWTSRITVTSVPRWPRSLQPKSQILWDNHFLVRRIMFPVDCTIVDGWNKENI